MSMHCHCRTTLYNFVCISYLASCASLVPYALAHHRIIALHSSSMLDHMLLSTSGTESPLPPLTRDTTPILHKVAPWLTAFQGVGYSRMACTTCSSHYHRGNCCHMEHRTCIDTLYVIITAQVPPHMLFHSLFFTWFDPKSPQFNVSYGNSESMNLSDIHIKLFETCLNKRLINCIKEIWWQ